METRSLHRLFIHTLKDTYNAEQQLEEALPEMAEAAGCAPLADIFEVHLGETRRQLERLETIFDYLEYLPGGRFCAGMRGILEESRSLIEASEMAPAVRDSALTVVAQKAEHYEITCYGTATHFAKLINEYDVADTLAGSLEEEKWTDAKLNELAKDMINLEAVGEE